MLLSEIIRPGRFAALAGPPGSDFPSLLCGFGWQASTGVATDLPDQLFKRLRSQHANLGRCSSVEHDAGWAGTFDFRGESVEVMRLPRSWRVCAGERTVEQRWLDESLTELFGRSYEVLRFEVEILEWASPDRPPDEMADA
jgi:hypothetical protein